jgi:hypothetical protein
VCVLCCGVCVCGVLVRSKLKPEMGILLCNVGVILILILRYLYVYLFVY